MNQPLNEAFSVEISQQIKSKAGTPFENAYQAALMTEAVTYVQGFVVLMEEPTKLIEHAWLEMGGALPDEEICLVDPTFPHFNRSAQNLCYFPAQRLTVKQLKAAVEEAQEDYPEDPPLPIYGERPYEYYGDLMLGGKEYLDAYQAANAKANKLSHVKS
jgi:hypothetical protein